MTDIHSCSLFCDRPACIKAQRDELRNDAARLDWLAKNPRLAELTVDDKTTDCYYYAVAGAPGLSLREIIDGAMAQEGPRG